MRQGGPNGRRPRGRHHGGHSGHGGHDRHSGGGGGGGGGNGGGGNGSNSGPSSNGLNANRPRSASALRHQTFDSHCLDVRVRGNAWQVCEKYQSLARDATSAGDRVAAENYLQHAEHYFRIIEAINEATAVEQRQRGGTPAPYGQQPEMPPGYFPTDGSAPQAPQGAPTTDANGNPLPPATTNIPEQQAQAEVIQQRPPQQQNPFFGTEEAEDQANGPEPLVARR